MSGCFVKTVTEIFSNWFARVSDAVTIIGGVGQRFGSLSFHGGDQ
jgi:hypothetical protein